MIMPGILFYGTVDKTSTDEQLLRECLKGNEDAWNAVIDKYRALIYSVPVKQGLPPDGATDVFQEVCLSLLSGISDIREPNALAAWLIRTAWHKSVHWKRNQQRYVVEEIDDNRMAGASGQPGIPETILAELEQEQLLRECVTGLSPRCSGLIQKLFYQSPAPHYSEVAQDLGITIGSVGAIRGRCLNKLRQRLEERGFR
ncbi:MAG: RNA polymerase sigma factor [Bryobacteraceae bacterium]